MQEIRMKSLDDRPEDEDVLLKNKTIKDEIEDELRTMELTEETTCGFWIFKGPALQRMANKKVLVFLFCLCGACYASTFSYFNGTITTIEKRFKIPSKITGFITTGNDVSQLLMSIVLNYYASKGHRPRWIAMSLFCVAFYCFLSILPHILYGPGEEAINLTFEYGGDVNKNVNNETRNELLCGQKDGICVLEDPNLVAAGIWFVAQLIAGVGRTLFHSVGYSYLDDNIKKSKSPSIIGFTYFMRMLGPAVGYAFVSLCLQWYIAPQLTPAIDPSDPRWLGAWWLGWIILGVTLMTLATLMAMLPRTLPRAAARKRVIEKYTTAPPQNQDKPSVKDMIVTIKRLLKNPIYNYNTLASLFYVFGYTPFWIFLPKYIETEFSKSAVTANMVTGTVGLAFSAFGVLVAGYVVQRLQPKAKNMAFWNMATDFLSALGILSYTLLGCPDVDEHFPNVAKLSATRECNLNCDCDLVRFSPICSMDKTLMFISPCHAGCTDQETMVNGDILFKNCSCIALVHLQSAEFQTDLEPYEHGGYATSGLCPIACNDQFHTFLIIICVCKLIGSLSRVTNFLVIIRCVEPKDISVSLGLALTIASVFAFIPAPIFFGYIIDTTCAVWGKTCEGTGNCWLYDPVIFRERLVYISSVFLMIGVLFDFLIWYKIKDIKIFDEGLKDLTPIKKDDSNALINETNL